MVPIVVEGYAGGSLAVAAAYETRLVALVIVVVRKRDISRALEVGAAVAFVLVLLGADVPTVIAFVYGIVMYPYAIACKPVDGDGVKP